MKTFNENVELVFLDTSSSIFIWFDTGSGNISVEECFHSLDELTVQFKFEKSPSAEITRR